MGRKVLLLEPDYKNKYPPMGLMKLATYYRECCKDDVRFYKGDLMDLAALLLCEEFIDEIRDYSISRYTRQITSYIRTQKNETFEDFPKNFNVVRLNKYCIRFKEKDIPKFDIVCITTLFTFYWKKTVETIKFAKNLCRTEDGLKVGGISASLVSKYIEEETGITPYIGLLDKPNEYFDIRGDSVIIDRLPLDYSILEETNYDYPAKDSYFAYTTRGCVNTCSFCAVPKLEPFYCEYVPLKEQLSVIEDRFGAKNNLLLMDNNVLASESFDKIIDEIKECGFGKSASYMCSNEYDIAFKNLYYNPRAYKRKIVSIYNEIAIKVQKEKNSNDFFYDRERLDLLFPETATIEAIQKFDEIARPLYDKYYKKGKRARYIDFNQGVDARYITDEKMKRIAELNIKPLRIAFDYYEKKDIYINAIKLAVKYGIKYLSNYLLYNYMDKPEELYNRLKINVELCEELNVTIYSFPMKYHPIDDPMYFKTRDYIGEHWNKKFIRAVQAVLNATKGKIGRGKIFFEDAFGKDIEEFKDILWMPETFIIYRQRYDENFREELRIRHGDKYRECVSEHNESNKWRELFHSIPLDKKEYVMKLVANNKFIADGDYSVDGQVQELLSFYMIKRPMY